MSVDLYFSWQRIRKVSIRSAERPHVNELVVVVLLADVASIVLRSELGRKRQQRDYRCDHQDFGFHVASPLLYYCSNKNCKISVRGSQIGSQQLLRWHMNQRDLFKCSLSDGYLLLLAACRSEEHTS